MKKKKKKKKLKKTKKKSEKSCTDAKICALSNGATRFEKSLLNREIFSIFQKVAGKI